MWASRAATSLSHHHLVLVGMAHAQRYSAFFYGTLLHPKILKRVIGNDGSHLEICPAVLLVSLANAPFLVRPMEPYRGPLFRIIRGIRSR